MTSTAQDHRTTTSDSSAEPRTRGRTSPSRGLAVAVAAALAVALLFALVGGFALRDPRPHDVPVGVAGPPPAVAAVQDGLDAAVPGGFEVRALPGDPEAAVADRQVDGALVLSPDGRAQVLSASGNGGSDAAVSSALQAAARASGAADVQVRDVAPATDDPRGGVLQQVVFAAVVASVAFAGIGYALARRAPVGHRLAASLGFGAALGLVVALAGDVLLGALPGAPWALAGVVALLGLAVALPAAGLARLVGPAGLGLVALTVVLLGNPTSGATIGRAFLPDGYRHVAGLLPNGAAVESAQSVLHFGGAGAGTPLLVLSLWALVGVALLLGAHLRESRSSEG